MSGTDRCRSRISRVLGRVWSVCQETAAEYRRDQASLLAAAIAFYGILALAPLLLLLMMIAQPFIGEESARRQLLDLIASGAGPSAASAVDRMLENLMAAQIGAELGALGVVVAVYAATRLFAQVQVAVNTAWNVRVEPPLGVRGSAWRLLRRRLLSFAMVTLLGLLLLASVAYSAVVHALVHWMPGLIPSSWLLWLADVVLSVLLGTIVFATIFKVLPDARIRWRDVWIGSLATATLFMLGRWALGFYFGRRGFDLGDSAGALVVLVLWAQYSAVVFVIGAELTQVIATRRGGLEPHSHAVSTSAATPGHPVYK